MKRFNCGTCGNEMEFKYDDYYLEHRGEIERITEVPQHVCHTCEVTAVLNSDIEKIRRNIDYHIFLDNLCGGVSND
jgi:YgiT-type zinc finger domain-containing protein